MSVVAEIKSQGGAAESDSFACAADQTMHAVRRGVVTGALFMVLLRMSFRLIGIVNTLVLVHLLVPGDFGLVGLVTAAYAILDLLSQMSLQLALIRMQSPTRADYDTAWTLGVVRGLIIAVLLILSAPLLAAYIHEPRTVQLAYVLAAISVVQGFENIRLVDLQREFRYDRIFLYQVAGKIAGIVVMIPLAFYFRNYWTLICGIAATRLTMIVMGYAMRPYRPRFSLASWYELFHFSKWLMAGNVLTVIDANAMTFLIGRIAGTAAIGMYQVGYQIGALPASEIAAPIRDPIYAGSARLTSNMSQLRSYFFENLELTIAVITPLSLGICLMAEPITSIFLGAKWVYTIPLIRGCALFALFDALGHYTNGMYTVLGRQRDYYVILGLVLIVRIPAIITGGIYAGPQGALAAVTATAVLSTVLWNAFLPHVLAVRFLDFVHAAWRTLVASVAMVIAVGGALDIYPEPRGIAGQLLRFVLICAGGAAIHIATQFAAWALSGFPDGAESRGIRGISMLRARARFSSV